MVKNKLKRYLKRARKIFEDFDPADNDFNIDRWLCLMDQLGDVHEWSDYKRIKFMEKKLKGGARTWFDQHNGFRFGWAELINKMKEAFPRQRDFAVCLEKLVGRRKRAEEPMTRYFHEKLALCERVGFEGVKAVACIIRGLPEEVQADAAACACDTPEALYSQFLAGLELYWSPKPKRAVRNVEINSTVVNTGSDIEQVAKEDAIPLKCYNCQETDHLSQDCPKTKSERCSHCSKEGHFLDTCPNGDGQQSEVIDCDEKVGDSVKMKLHNEPLNIKKSFDATSSTPVSPTPTTEMITSERSENTIPKIDIYNSAAESLVMSKLQNDRPCKPPISLDDLKTLEEDVQKKIVETAPNEATVQEPTTFKEKLMEQISRVDVLLRSNHKQKRDDLEPNNPVVENILSLRKKLAFDWKPENFKRKEKLKTKEEENSMTCLSASLPKTIYKISQLPTMLPNVFTETGSIFGNIRPSQTEEKGPIVSSSKKKHKRSQPSKKTRKILKEPSSIFENIFPHRDEQLFEGKKKKKERRNFRTRRDKNKSYHHINKRDGVEKQDYFDEGTILSTGKGERKSGGKELDTGKKEPHHQSEEQNKLKDSKGREDNKGSTTLIPGLSPDVLQNILAPGTTELINNVVNQLRHNTREIVKDMPVSQTLPAQNFVENNLGFEHNREDFTTDNFNPSNMPEYINFQSQSPPVTEEQPEFEQPHLLNNQVNYMTHPDETFIPAVEDGFNDDCAPNSSFTPIPQGVAQPNLNIPSTSYNIQSPDCYPSNTSMSSNRGIPLLSPIPAFQNDQIPANFGIMPNHDLLRYNEDMRWRQENDHFSLDQRNPDFTLKRVPRTYREYREMKKDTRENRVRKDPRENREARDLRENYIQRDPRLNRDRGQSDKSTAREIHQVKDDQRIKDHTRTDRMDSTNTDKSRSRTRSKSYSKDTFICPRDSLYTGKDQRAGKGYGIQNFRIPKITKENKKEQFTKVSNTNEDADAAIPQIITDHRNDNTNDEFPGNDIEVKEAQDLAEGKESKEQGHEENTNKTKLEQEKNNLESSKVLSEREEKPVEDATPKPIELDQAKPLDQTVLAQFFANLLGSKDKKDKKTALYSLITTFSDSFGEKQLSEITKIIKPNDEEEDSEEEEDVKSQKKLQIESSKAPETEIDMVEAYPDSPVKATKRKFRRIRKISSTASSKDKETKKEEVSKPELPETPKPEEESVAVPEGTTTTSRKRALVAASSPRKKFRTELDKLHEDIQSIFIHDDVATVTGKRSCRLLKADHNALTIPESSSSAESPKIDTTLDPKHKQSSNSSQMKAMRNVQVLIPKIPDNSVEEEHDSPRRTSKTAYAESDEEEISAPADADSSLGEGSFREESVVETTDTEKSFLSTDNTDKKVLGKKRGKRRAFGNVPNKKRKQLPVAEPTDENKTEDSSVVQLETAQSFMEPDKNYYLDFVSNKPYKCKLCDYKGRYITIHYKTAHSNSEVLISRFSPAVAQEAIEDSKRNLAKYEKVIMKGSKKYNFTCRFCSLNTTEHLIVFYDHIARHTGEYRHVCPICDFSAPNAKSLKSHMSTVHNYGDKRLARKSYGETVIFAYICGECNYVQLSENNVKDHINLFHLQKPTIYKVNMSSTMDPQVIQLAESTSVADEEAKADEEPPIAIKEKVKQADQAMLPPQPIKRMKAAPKCVKDKLKALQELAERGGDTNHTNFPSSPNIGSELEKLDIPERSSKQLGPVSKRRLTRELSMSSEEDLIIPGRSRRAAKDKATEKLKSLMEVSESGSRKKSHSSTEDERKTKEKETKRENVQTNTKQKGLGSARLGKKLVLEKKEGIPCVKKEVEMNVSRCVTDIQEETKKIEQDNLCSKLNQKDMIVKQEPRDDLTDSQFPINALDASPIMPVLEKNLPTHFNEPISTRPLIIPPVSTKTEHMQISNSNFDVTQKTDMVQNFKGKLDSNIDDISDSSPITGRADLKELSNVKPTDGSTKTLLIGGLVKVIKQPNHLLFSCLVSQCVFLSENKEAFQKHCSGAHEQQGSSTLCEMCGMEIVADKEFTLLENIFKHVVQVHEDFMNNDLVSVKEDHFKAPAKLRLRKLSGDLLSVKQDWEEAIDELNSGPVEKDEGNAPLVSEVTASVTETLLEPSTSVAELEMDDENPFPFKIAAVMSLAEPVPPLMPIAKVPLRVTSTKQPEAFAVMRNVVTVPRKVSNQYKSKKFEKGPLAVRVKPKAANFGKTQKTTLKVMSQNIAKDVCMPSNTSMISHALKVVNTNSVATSQYLILPTATSVNALGGIVCSTGKTFNAIASGPTTVEMVPSLEKVTTDQTQKNVLVQEDTNKGGEEADRAIEHCYVTEQNDIGETDPLSLDTFKSAAHGGDKSKGDKPNTGMGKTKTGLMSYQLFRCAVCDSSFSNSVTFKVHLKDSVTCWNQSKQWYRCVHCERQTKSPQALVNHIQCHGLPRFTCSLCEIKYTTFAWMRNHVKNQHNIMHPTFTPVNPAKQNIDTDEFLVGPK